MTRCVVCGALPVEQCNRKTHFIHDHITLFDGSVVLTGTLRHFPPPYVVNPSIRRLVLAEWATYEVA